MSSSTEPGGFGIFVMHEGQTLSDDERFEGLRAVMYARWLALWPKESGGTMTAQARYFLPSAAGAVSEAMSVLTNPDRRFRICRGFEFVGVNMYYRVGPDGAPRSVNHLPKTEASATLALAWQEQKKIEAHSFDEWVRGGDVHNIHDWSPPFLEPVEGSDGAVTGERAELWRDLASDMREATAEARRACEELDRISCARALRPLGSSDGLLFVAKLTRD